MAVIVNGQSERSGARKPDEVAKVSPNLEVNLWIRKNEFGSSYHWNLARIGENGRRFKSFHAETLLELPEALAVLCRCFAKAPDLAVEVRERLEKLGAILPKLDEFVQLNAQEKENGHDQSVLGS